MVLNKTNTLDDKATFLDLDITNIVNNKFTTTVYDKRNDFGFNDNCTKVAYRQLFPCLVACRNL